MGIRYFIRFKAKIVPPFGDASDNCEVLLNASSDVDARAEFNDFCHKHPTEFEGRVITSSIRLIKEETLAEV